MVIVLNTTDLTPQDKLILLGIANHDGDGGAWPSVATLARYGCCSPRTVQRSLQRLTEAGFVTVEKQAGGSRETRPDRRPNLYRLHLSGLVDNHDNGVTPVTPREANGVTPVTERGDTAMSPEPSLNHLYEIKRDSYVMAVPALCTTSGCNEPALPHKFRCSAHHRDGSGRGVAASRRDVSVWSEEASA